MTVEPLERDDGPFPGLRSRLLVNGHARSDANQQARSVASGKTLALAVFALLVFSRGWVRLLPGAGEIEAEGNALVRNLFLPGYLAGLALLLCDPRTAARASVAGALPLALVVLAFISSVWSIAPDLSVRRAFALLLTTLTAIAIASRLDWLSMARALGATFSLLALASTVLAIAMPQFGRMQELFPGAWRGVWSEKNALGDYMALGVCACLSAAVMDRRLRAAWVSGAALCLLLVLLSTSKTSLVCLSAGVAALIAVWLARKKPAIAVGVVFVGGALVVVSGVSLVFMPHLLFDILGKDETLTGRTAIWRAVLRRVAERPLTGYGYAVVWSDTSGLGPLAWISKELQFVPKHAHNSWLAIQLELGVTGLGLLVAFAGQTLWRLLRAGQGALLAAPFLSAFVVVSLTETVILNYNDFLWVIVPAIAIRLGLSGVAEAGDQFRPLITRSGRSQHPLMTGRPGR